MFLMGQVGVEKRWVRECSDKLGGGVGVGVVEYNDK